MSYLPHYGVDFRNAVHRGCLRCSNHGRVMVELDGSTGMGGTQAIWTRLYTSIYTFKFQALDCASKCNKMQTQTCLSLYIYNVIRDPS